MVSSVGGEQQLRMSMSGPVLSQQLKRRRGEWNVTVLGPLAAMDVNHAALGIDVADLQVEAFLHPQAERIDGPEVDGHPLGVRGQDNLKDLLAGDYFRERRDVLEFHLP